MITVIIHIHIIQMLYKCIYVKLLRALLSISGHKKTVIWEEAMK